MLVEDSQSEGRIFPLTQVATRAVTWAAVMAAREWLDRKLKVVKEEQEIRKLATMTKLKRLLSGADAQPAEVFWMWAAEATREDGEGLAGQGGSGVEGGVGSEDEALEGG